MSDAQTTPATPRPNWRAEVVIAAIGVPVLVLLFWIMTFKPGPHDFDGYNTALYDADDYYGVALTHDEADRYVWDISQAGDLSRNDAEALAIVYARVGLAPKLWAAAARRKRTIDALKAEGVIPKDAAD